MADTRTTADAILKDWYWGDKVFPQMITDTPLLSKIKTSKDNIINDVGGRKVVFPLRTAYGQGMGARAAGDPLPQARNQQFAVTEFGMKKMVSRVEVQGEAWRSTEGAGMKAFVNLLREAITDALGGHAKELNGTMYRDGTGNRTAVTVASAAVAPGASGTFTVANPQYLFQGMLFDVYTGAVLTANGANLILDSVDRETGVVGFTNPATAAGAVTVAIADDIYRAGNKDKEIMGLDGIVDDGTLLASLQGITVASNPFWSGKVLDNPGPRPLTLDLMEQAYNVSMSETNEAPDAIVMDFRQKRAYEQLLVSDKRYNQSRDLPKLDGGYGSLTYNNVPIIFDTDCQPGTIYFLNTKYLRCFQQFGYQWVTSPDAKFLWSRVAGFDSYEAVALYEAEFAVLRRNNQVKVTDLVV